MKITICRNKSLTDKLLEKDLDSFKQLQRNNSIHFTTRDSKESPKQRKGQQQNIVNNASNGWFLMNCLNGQRQESSTNIRNQVRLEPQKPIPLRHVSCEINGNRSLSRQSKLQIAGTRSKTKQKERNYPKSLCRLKELKSQQLIDMKNQTVQQKSNQILKTKRCTESHPSPSLSYNSSNKMLLDQSVRHVSPLNRSSNGKKMDLTISKKLNMSQEKNNQNKKSLTKNNIFIKSQAYKTGQFKNKSFVESDTVKGMNDKKSHFHSSTNQFIIVDPLDQLKSQNTQRLKKKMIFSWVRSDKEEDVLDKLQVPMLSIRQSNSEYLLQSHKNANQIHKSMAVLGNQAIKGSKAVSGESIVVMKGAETIFDIPSPSFKDFSKQNVNLSDSIIEHTEVAADEQSPWYKMI